MESGDLKIFQAVAREGNITRAAARLGYVQSNVTARIRQLESELNTPLFYRQSRGVALTSAGSNLLKYADQITHLLEEAVKSTQYSEEPSGPLRIGSLETTAAVHLPGIMLDYHKQYPEVKLSLVTGHTSKMVESLLNYELDASFISGPLEHPELEAICAFREELVLVSEPTNEGLEEVLERPFLFFWRGLCPPGTTGAMASRGEGDPIEYYGIWHPGGDYRRGGGGAWRFAPDTLFCSGMGEGRQSAVLSDPGALPQIQHLFCIP